MRATCRRTAPPGTRSSLRRWARPILTAGSSTAWAAVFPRCPRFACSHHQREDADIDYTFAQVQIRESRVDYKSNCGNMSSAVGPFAIDEGLVRAGGDTATVRIFNTNTRKIIRATFPLEGARARYDGDLAIPGVAGTGAAVRLDFVEPGGAATGKLLPSGRTIERLEVPGFGPIEASLVDAANPAVFLRAADIG